MVTDEQIHAAGVNPAIGRPIIEHAERCSAKQLAAIVGISFQRATILRGLLQQAGLLYTPPPPAAKKKKRPPVAKKAKRPARPPMHPRDVRIRTARVALRLGRYLIDHPDESVGSVVATFNLALQTVYGARSKLIRAGLLEPLHRRAGR